MVDAFRRALGGLSSRRTLTALEINLGVLGLPLNDEKIGEDVVLSMVYQEDERLRKREDEASKPRQSSMVCVGRVYAKTSSF